MVRLTGEIEHGATVPTAMKLAAHVPLSFVGSLDSPPESRPGVDARDYAADREPHLPVHWMGVPLHGQVTWNTCNGLKLPVRVRGTLARSLPR